MVARWRGEDTLEHLVLTESPDAVVAESVLIAKDYAAHYRLECDAQWRARRLEVTVLGRGTLVLENQEVDIWPTPFTNTLPIRRGASADIEVAWVRLPELTVERKRQRYERLGPTLWRFTSLDSGYRADITVDAHGLVIDYPELFTRIP